MIKKSAVLIALISPILMTGCQSTPDNYSAHNFKVESNLTPITEFFQGYLYDKCESEITIDNYLDILTSKQSGFQGNPFNSDCFPVSFNIQEPEDFYSDIVKQSNDPEKAQELLGSIKRGFDEDGKTKGGIKNRQQKDTRYVQKLILKDGRFMQIMKFAESDFTNKIKERDSNRDDLQLVYDEFFFLHELFHLTDMNYDKSLPQSVKESYSDVASVITISTTHSLDLEKTIDLAKDIYYTRKSEASNKYNSHISGSHWNSQMLTDFIDYLEDIEKTGGNLRRVSSLEEAGDLAMNISVKLNQNERNDFITGDFYWQPGMKVGDNEKTASVSYKNNAFPGDDSKKEIIKNRLLSKFSQNIEFEETSTPK